MSQTLNRSDALGLSSAAGWLELGNFEEGLHELDQLSPDAQRYPDVLEVKWLLLASRQDWSRALQVADQTVSVAPERPSGWVHKAYALRRVPGGGLAQAEAVLIEAAKRFPQTGVIPYNLACYACQMGREAAALEWLERALALEDKTDLKAMALRDDDLKPLWPRIQEM